MANQYVRQATLQYSTFIKRGLVESLTDAFAGHPDPTTANSFVGIDFSHKRFKLPATIIKFYEREMPNAGVTHREWLYAPPELQIADPPTLLIEYQHRLYKGDIEFEIWGMSSLDRDLVRDALIEVLGMWGVSQGGLNFIHRLWDSNPTTPYGAWHYPVMNFDLITGYGETATIAPWIPEDTMVYSCSYRVPIFGEFYSMTPADPTLIGVIEEVDVYPWIMGTDPAPPVPISDYYRYTGASTPQPIGPPYIPPNFSSEGSVPAGAVMGGTAPQVVLDVFADMGAEVDSEGGSIMGGII